MKNLIGGLVVLITAALLLGCGENNAANTRVQLARIGENPEACDSVKGTALSINLRDANGMLSGVRVDYRKDNGPWTLREEYASGSTFIEGTAGTYLIKAQKKGYQTETALVVVPNDTDCSLLKQEVGFVFVPAFCPVTNEIVVNVIEPRNYESLGFYIHRPEEDPIIAACNSLVRDRCEFNLSVANEGIYEVVFSGFPNPMQTILVNDDIIRNEYPVVEVIVSFGSRKHRVISEAVDRIKLNIPYHVGESGCYEVDFDNLTADVDGILTSETGEGRVYEGPTFQLVPLTSEQCSQSTQKKPVSFVMEVPTGTSLNNLKVEYWLGGQWREAECQYENQLICRAEIDNPLIGDKYHFRMTVNNEELIGYYIPLMNNCMVFD